MASLANNNGKLILRDGKLGTGEECCCGVPPPPCGASCGPSSPCPEGCECIGCLCVPQDCELPDQITLTASGIPNIVSHGSSFGAGASAQFAAEWAQFCGIDGPCFASSSSGGGGGNSWYAGLVSRDESSIVLDRDCGATYTGVLPDLAFASHSFNNFQGFDAQSCGGSVVNGVRGVSVSLGVITADTSVSISPPSWGESTATATADVAGGQVSKIEVTEGGEGYAREIMERSEPTITAAIPAGTGSGAALTVTLSKNGQGEDATWAVSSVGVTNAGSGYTGGEWVEFTPGVGATTGAGASAQVIVGRVQPTVTASVSSGTGGTLSVSLAQGFDWWTNQPYWYIDSVSVTSGGSGYTDGESVAFTVTDGTQDYAASASISAPTGQIESVYVNWGGSYYKTTGAVQSVQIFEGGAYYVETGTGEVEADTPVVTITSNVGEGAEATATVDEDLESPTFGQITEIAVTQGGQGYESGVDRWRISISYDNMEHASLSERLTSNSCPTELFSRSYAMAMLFNSAPGFFSNGCGEPASVTDNGNGTSKYRFTGISISLSPA
jgi:hypothetical protein